MCARCLPTMPVSSPSGREPPAALCLHPQLSRAVGGGASAVSGRKWPISPEGPRERRENMDRTARGGERRRRWRARWGAVRGGRACKMDEKRDLHAACGGGLRLTGVAAPSTRRFADGREEGSGEAVLFCVQFGILVPKAGLRPPQAPPRGHRRGNDALRGAEFAHLPGGDAPWALRCVYGAEERSVRLLACSPAASLLGGGIAKPVPAAYTPAGVRGGVGHGAKGRKSARRQLTGGTRGRSKRHHSGRSSAPACRLGP